MPAAEDEFHYRQILKGDPHRADAWQMLGVTLFGQNRFPEAVEALRRAVALDPNQRDHQYNLGFVLATMGDRAGAIAPLEIAARLDPHDIDALTQLGNVHVSLRNCDQAADAFGRAVARRPDFDDALNNLAMALKDLGRLKETMEWFDKLLKRNPHHVVADSNRIYSMLFFEENPQALLAEHRIWNRRHAEPLAGEIKPHENDRDPERARLRIGYVSPNFDRHVQVLYTIPLLSRHDHQKFEIFCYADVPRPDSFTAEIQSYADVWRSTVGMTDSQVAEMIRGDRIDVLVDLTMHMSRGRPLVFARKPAPVQIAWLAYPGTSGLTAIDYRLTDPYLDPPGVGDENYSEKSIRLPETFWCFDPLGEDPTVQALPASRNGYITFGSLNNFCKVNPPLLRLWGRILNGVPHSRMIVLAPEGSARRRVLEVMGIAQERIDFVPIQDRQKYLEVYHRIDLGLDTYPYNAAYDRAGLELDGGAGGQPDGADGGVAGGVQPGVEPGANRDGCQDPPGIC